jgi:hypothetical protein
MTEASPVKLTNRQSWKALGTHYKSIRNVHLRTLFTVASFWKLREQSRGHY